MKKSLYSLMLMDDVVSEIDKIAHKKGMNRSSLINRILAEYASVTTPEMRINDIFSQIEEMFSGTDELVPLLSRTQSSMSLKSSLDYKYRPTVRYEVELAYTEGVTRGRLSVIFRTQSAPLLADMADFFRLWKRLEDAYLPRTAHAREYELYDGRFIRTFTLGDTYATSSSMSRAISDYVSMLDDIMKSYLTGRYTAAEIETKYVSYLRRGIGII